jgi:hypothetical protein
MVIYIWDFGSSIKYSRLQPERLIPPQELQRALNALHYLLGEIVPLFMYFQEVRPCLIKDQLLLKLKYLIQVYLQQMTLIVKPLYILLLQIKMTYFSILLSVEVQLLNMHILLLLSRGIQMFHSQIQVLGGILVI